MIVACSLYFGDAFGTLSAIGVTVSASGGYAFTIVKKQQDAAKSSKTAKAV